MAKVGEQLLIPESGWRRIDDTHPCISYIGNGWTRNVSSAYYNGSYTWTSNPSGTKIKFSFIGTKIRIISSVHSIARSENQLISIDGVIEKYSLLGIETIQQCLVYEKIGLPKGLHHVEITIDDPSNDVNHMLDAIDIDYDGLLSREKRTFSDMQIGDVISCDYTCSTGNLGAFANFGKAEYPLFQYKNGYYSNSGSFNFIYVDNDYKGRKILVADRNIQNYISAHRLDNSGITSSTGTPYVTVVNPILSSETSHSTIGVAICSSTAYSDGSRAAWKAFSGNPQASWMSKTVPEWLGFQWTTPKVVNGYSYGIENAAYSPRSWILQGSNNGETWDNLHQVDDYPYSSDDFPRTFYFNNEKAYKSYRIYAKQIYTTASPRVTISNFKFLYKGNDKFSLRLLTGGIDSNDKDSEWDRYIVNSNLNGTIKAGDNFVWNWQEVYSHTSSISATDLNYKVLRGRNSVDTWNRAIMNESNSLYGFRPVLVVEPSYDHKYLIQIENDVYNIANKKLTKVGVSPATPDMFVKHGLENLVELTEDIIETLPSQQTQILCWTNNIEKDERKLVYTGYKKNKFKYKVDFGDPTQTIKDWSNLTNSPVTDTALIPSSNLTSVTNPYYMRVIVKQNNGTQVSKDVKLLIYDTPPKIIGDLIGRTLEITFGDEENDRIRFNVKLNGKQIYPSIGFTDLYFTPYKFQTTLNSEDIVIGSTNTIEINAEDEYGSPNTYVYSWIGDYIGLMFSDEKGKYYSTDAGEVLQYLSFGTIIAGQTTLPVKVNLTNKEGMDIKNLKVELHAPAYYQTQIQLSKTENPFVSEQVLTFEDIQKKDENMSFYVRIVTNADDDAHSGEFDIYAEAEPASES
ncbi:hypothetical protein [Brevibacillus laterosporus]|uniref:hypothetical protein n=1 Tax=Brevibacillus laterosporus TaxID=1465 RepID=UPI000E6C918A|nr:hypothetical protein [Brevibacillus laterosporus]AYB37507.1 hypothetical protein D5F52_04015 [Brevibacillus laterosporus]MBM7111524.1 hypothetical protein [Brevibacillus laterosporus]